MRDFEIIASITMRADDRGVLVSHGDQGGGYLIYVNDNRPVFLFNDGRGAITEVTGDRLAPGPREVKVSVSAAVARMWSVRLSIDGVACGEVEGLAALFPMSPFEGIDVGLDRRSPVSWEIAQREGTFAYSGVLHSVRYVPGEGGPMAPSKYIDLMRQMAAQYA